MNDNKYTGGANPVKITSAEQFVNLLNARSHAAVQSTPSLAGKPYCPGSGTEGMAFEEAFCNRCAYYDDTVGCPIINQVTDVADIHDPTYPNQWVYDEKGFPTCLAFEEFDERHRLCGGAATSEQEQEAYEKALRGD